MTKKTVSKKYTKPYVIVRTYSAGVHVGVLESRKGQEVRLSSARRIWKWAGANTLHEISLRGVGSGSKVSETVKSIELTQAIEVIPCEAAARRSLETAPWGQ